MPIFEFKCPDGHVTEKVILDGNIPSSVICQAKVGLTYRCDSQCNVKDPDHRCLLDASRLEVPTRSSFRLKPGGVGGFHKPHQD